MIHPRSLLSAARLLSGFVSSRHRAGRNWNDALSLVKSGACAGVSLDCFETLLARPAPDWEQRILAEMVGGATGHPRHHANSVFAVAQRRARQRDGEPSATAIWAEYCAALGIPGQMAARLSAHEFELLKLTSSASAEALEFIAVIKSLRLPWIVCSDTRWSGAELSRLLSLKGVDIGKEAVFSSCDHGHSKFRGGLYAIAHKYLHKTIGSGTSRADIIHVGDNFFSDCCSAACYGWRAIVIPSQRQAEKPIIASVSAHLEALRQDLAENLR